MAYTTWGSSCSKKRKRSISEENCNHNTTINNTPANIKHTETNNTETIFRINNHLYFYDSVSKKNNLRFTILLRDIDNEQQIKLQHNQIELPTIHIHINSGGGSLLDGFSMASAVINCKSHTISYVEGIVASAASLPLVVSNERKIQQYCYVLIHQLSSSSWGTYENFKDEKNNLDNFMNQLSSLYLKYTKVPDKKLKNILKHDLYWDANTCLKYKIVDSIC